MLCLVFDWLIAVRPLVLYFLLIQALLRFVRPCGEIILSRCCLLLLICQPHILQYHGTEIHCVDSLVKLVMRQKTATTQLCIVW